EDDSRRPRLDRQLVGTCHFVWRQQFMHDDLSTQGRVKRHTTGRKSVRTRKVLPTAGISASAA
ncbi:hypothetical protein ABTN16_19835, partial [Acinetobacter baumannii]